MPLPILRDLSAYEQFWLLVVTRTLGVLTGLWAATLLLLRFWIVPALIRGLKG